MTKQTGLNGTQEKLREINEAQMLNTAQLQHDLIMPQFQRKTFNMETQYHSHNPHNSHFILHGLPCGQDYALICFTRHKKEITRRLSQFKPRDAVVHGVFATN